MPLLLIILLFAAAGGIASAAVAVVFLWVPERHLTRILSHLVSFATGALLGAALLALLPEAIEGAGPSGARDLGLALLVGFGVFFVIEKLVLWWHAHDEEDGASDRRRGRATVALVLVGDSIHNALDGVLIAAAFLTNIPLGLLTTLAVAAHEIPHRAGDFALLVHAGLSRERALFLNLATGIASPLGALVAFYGLRKAIGLLPYALGFAAAGFLYIALAGLVPDLQRRSDPRTSVMQVLLMALAVVVIAAAEALSHQ